VGPYVNFTDTKELACAQGIYYFSSFPSDYR